MRHAHDGAQLPARWCKTNTASDVWADTAYRSKANRRSTLADNQLRSIRSTVRSRKGVPCRRTCLAGPTGSSRKSGPTIEHVFARLKGPMALVVRTIGLARARVKIGLANIVYNMRRFVWLDRRHASAAAA